MLKRSVRRHWRCHKCRQRMHAKLAKETQQLTGFTAQEMVHVCGTCKATHRITDKGSLRLTTAAENAELRRLYPDAMALIEATTFEPTNQPHGTLIISTENR